ncbi:MAG: winged helix-turn-helix domain-containing protein [Bryobacterales bacterium]|nr:winged helix-turn-helix domain-containing protein [Bryobacterales bacterium]
MLAGYLTSTYLAPYQDKHLTIDYNRAEVFLDGIEVPFTRKEFNLLALMVQNQGEIVPRDILLYRVWGYGRDVRTRTLDVHIRRLRKKLAPFGDTYIETVFGVGYRFQEYRLQKPLNTQLHTPVYMSL